MNALNIWVFVPHKYSKDQGMKGRKFRQTFGIYPKAKFSIPDTSLNNTDTVESVIGKKAYLLTYKSTYSYSTSSNNFTFSIINF